MANFNELIKHYRNEVTDQDPEEFVMSATYAAESIEEMASKYAEKVDADMTMSIVILAVAHYLDVQDEKFEKRRARNSAQEPQAEMEAKEVESSDSIKCSECGQTIYLDTPQDKAAAAAGHDTCADCNTTEENKISSLSESFKQEITAGLKKIL